MGANEYGVVIGNEAVWTREPLVKEALLGMDLLRLGLERAKTARIALDVITDLLDQPGQGGNCALDLKFNYHNSFLISDARGEAYILETAGKWWVAKKVTEGIRNISNCLSIRREFDLSSEGLIDYAIDAGYCSNREEFDFAKCFSSVPIADYSSPDTREGRGKLVLEKNLGKITPEAMMNILRDHPAGICMHGDFRTTASMVSILDDKKEKSIHWFTGTPHPCRSVFKPFFFGDGTDITLPECCEASLEQDFDKLWWSFENALLKNQINLKKSHKLEKKYLKLAIDSLTETNLNLDHQNITLNALKEEMALYH